MANFAEKAKSTVLELFKRFDRNGDGCINRTELARVLQGLNPSFTPECMQRVFDAIDDDRNNRISVQEFVNWCWISRIAGGGGPGGAPGTQATDEKFSVGGLTAELPATAATRGTATGEAGRREFLADGSFVLTPATHRSTLVFLHGAFQKASEYADAMDQGIFKPPSDCKVLVPQAPTRQLELPPLIPGLPDERLVPCWYSYPQDRATAEASIDAICGILREEAKLVGEANTHLAGYSQGASIAWVIHMKSLAPIGSFTSYCSGPGLGFVVKTALPEAIAAPALVCVGAEDQIFSPALTGSSIRELRGSCDTSAIRLRVQEGVGHEVPRADGFAAMVDFLGAVERCRHLKKSVSADGSLVLAPKQHRRTLIFLHGAFEQAQQYGEALDQSRFLPPADCKVIVPQAPTRKIDMPQGIPGLPDERVAPCWYNFPQDKATALESIDRICGLIREEAKLVGEANVHLAGFSQGASIAWVIFMKQLVQIASFTSFCAGPALGAAVKSELLTRIGAPALVYLGAEDAIFSPTAVQREVEVLSKSCDVSRIFLQQEEGLGHEPPGATGFAAMTEFIDRVDASLRPGA